MNHIHTWDQLRAQDAWHKTQEIKSSFPKKADDYASYVTSMPAAILINGLGQAVTQLLAAAKRQENYQEDAHYLLYIHIQSWLCGEEKRSPYLVGSDLIEAIIHSDQQQYKKATKETLAWLNWHKKFASAHLKERTVNQ
jgi:CRISPR-associated protein Cmr5